MNQHVRQFLIELARKRTNQTITYQKLSDACNLGLNMQEGQHIRAEIGKILGEISSYEHENDRPLLSALVLRANDDYEGDGFYKLADELGYGDWKKLKREGIFEAMQIKECIEYWSNDSNYNKFR
jgi:hypothetical protein